MELNQKSISGKKARRNEKQKENAVQPEKKKQAGSFMYAGQVMIPHGKPWASNGLIMQEYRGQNDGESYVFSENAVLD